MAYKSPARKIRDALVTLLQGVTYDTGGGAEPAFGLVTKDPAADTNQEPYALVYPAPQTDTKGAVGQNDRGVGFAILVLLSLENKQRTQAQTWDYMLDLTDLILDVLDEADFHDSLNTSDPTIGTWLLESARSSITLAESKQGAVLLCEVDVTVTYSKNL